MAQKDEAEDKKSVNVVDRRRFDSAGEERKDSSEGASAQAAQSSQSGKVTQDAQRADKGFTLEHSDQKEEVAFGSFIMSLATQVLVQIGDMPAPQGMEIPVDLNAARQTIDIISMLQRRTRGNLSAEESHFLEEVLHSLRTSFVAKSKGA